MIPTTDMVRNLFYASGSKSVHTVIVDGKVVLDGGRFVTVDEGEMLRAINTASLSLLSRMGKLPVERNRIVRPVRSVGTT